MITNPQSNFYLKYNLEVHTYLKLRPEIKYWFVKWTLLTILGEVQYLLNILVTQTDDSLTWIEIAVQLGGLSKVMQICDLLKIKTESDLDGDRYHYLINNVSIKDAVDTLTLERNQLITKIETELGLPIDVLNLVINSLGDKTI